MLQTFPSFTVLQKVLRRFTHLRYGLAAEGEAKPDDGWKARGLTWAEVKDIEGQLFDTSAVSTAPAQMDEKTMEEQASDFAAQEKAAADQNALVDISADGTVTTPVNGTSMLQRGNTVSNRDRNC